MLSKYVNLRVLGRSSVITFCFLCLTFIPVNNVAFAKKVIQWKLSTFEPAISVMTEGQKWWANEIERRSNGRLKIKIYLQNQLCSAKEMIESVSSGYADVVSAVPAYTPAKTPLGTLNYVPFMCPNRNDLSNYLWARMSENPLFIKENEKNNCVFAYYHTTQPYNIMGRVPINTVEDFKGLKIRAVGDQAELFKMVGATPVCCTAPEIYTALERGLFDAVPGCGEYWFSNWRLFDVLKGGYYILSMDINMAGYEVLINKDSYDALPKDIQDIIQHLKWEMPTILHEYISSPEVVEYFMTKFRNAGIKISHFPKEERQKLLSHAPAVWDKWKARHKKAGSFEFFDAFVKEREKVMKQFPEGIYTKRPLPSHIKTLLPKL